MLGLSDLPKVFYNLGILWAIPKYWLAEKAMPAIIEGRGFLVRDAK
jgi:hypothetical protein